MTYPFRVEVKEVPTETGWKYAEVSVFDDTGRLLGTYERNYFGFAKSTFHPFFLEGRWWALYAPAYTATRVVTLPELEDWCGEEAAPAGFCPVEFYVPTIRKVEYLGKDKDRGSFLLKDGKSFTPWKRDAEYKIGPSEWLPFGFVAGCIWGDDSYWKVQYLDLSRLKDRTLRREERFGYFPIPGGVPLREAVNMGDWTPKNPIISIKGINWFNLETREPIDPLEI